MPVTKCLLVWTARAAVWLERVKTDTTCWGLCARREFSKQLNESRIKVLQAREASVHGIVSEAHKRLLDIANSKKAYKGLLTDLTVQV